jgi:hypothetical protein
MRAGQNDELLAVIVDVDRHVHRRGLRDAAGVLGCVDVKFIRVHRSQPIHQTIESALRRAGGNGRGENQR